MTAPVYNGPNTSTASGVSDTFPYYFKILQASDLLVTVNGLPRVLNTHYTVTGVGDPAGGNVVFQPGHLPTAGQIVDRRRNMPIRRDTNYLTLGDLLATTLNDDQDAPVLMIQQLLFSTLQLILDPDGSGEFVWDAKGNRIIRVGDGVADTDAANMRSLYAYVEQVLGGGGVVGVAPRVYPFTGDGIEPDMPIPGADVSDPAMYDTYIETAAGNGVWIGQRPGTDYGVEIGADTADSVMPFTTPLGNGVRGFAVLRGYARPYTGAEPITTTAMAIYRLAGTSLTVDGTFHNTKIITESDSDVTITIRANTGSAAEDWRAGEFFLVEEEGNGKVTVAAESPGTMEVPDDYQAKTRAPGSTIGFLCNDASADAWTASGDLLRDAVEANKIVLWMDDRTVLGGSNIATGTTKGNFIMPFDFILDPIADGGLYGSLSVAQASGATLTVDVNVNGASILATKLTFDNTEKSTLTAATPAAYDSTFNSNGRLIAKGAEVTFDHDAIGTAGARGMRIYMVGQRAG